MVVVEVDSHHVVLEYYVFPVASVPLVVLLLVVAVQVAYHVALEYESLLVVLVAVVVALVAVVEAHQPALVLDLFVVVEVVEALELELVAQGVQVVSSPYPINSAIVLSVPLLPLVGF